MDRYLENLLMMQAVVASANAIIITPSKYPLETKMARTKSVLDIIDACDNPIDLVKSPSGYNLVELTSKGHKALWMLGSMVVTDEEINLLKSKVNSHNSMVVA